MKLLLLVYQGLFCMLTPITNAATIADFTIAYGDEETLEITNLCDELATTVNTVKLQSALDRAHDLINSKFYIASDCGRALIKVSAKQLVLWISRYLLDTTKSRPMVDEDYKNAMDYLQYACTECVSRCPLSKEEIESILGFTGTSRSRFRGYSGSRCNIVSPQVFRRGGKVDNAISSENTWKFFTDYRGY